MKLSTGLSSSRRADGIYSLRTFQFGWRWQVWCFDMMRVISKRHKDIKELGLEAIMCPAGSVRPHPRENSSNWPHYGWRGTEIKERSSGPIVLSEIRFRFHSYIQIILRSTAIHRVAIYHPRTHTLTHTLSTWSRHLSVLTYTERRDTAPVERLY